MDSEISARLSTYVARTILRQPSRRIQATEPLISSGLVDSFSLVDLALFVEDAFGVHIGDTELNAETFDSLQELTELIEARRAQ